MSKRTWVGFGASRWRGPHLAAAVVGLAAAGLIVAASSDRRSLAGVALAGQRGHLLVEQLLHMHQAQGHQGPDQLHLGVQLQLGVVLAASDVDPPKFAGYIRVSQRA